MIEVVHRETWQQRTTSLHVYRLHDCRDKSIIAETVLFYSAHHDLAAKDRTNMRYVDTSNKASAVQPNAVFSPKITRPSGTKFN